MSSSAASATAAARTVEALATTGFTALEELEESLGERPLTTAGSLWGSAQPFVVAILADRSALAGRPLLLVASTDIEAESLRDDLTAFGQAATLFPSREGYAGREGSAGRSGRGLGDVDAIRDRLQLAQAFAARSDARPRVLVTSMQALLQPIPTLRDLENEFLELEVGTVLDAEKLVRHLVHLGYSREPLAESPGEISLRGDILDVFPFAADLPLRIELFEDEIESLRTFETADQRSVESLEKVEVCLAADIADPSDADGALLVELMHDDTLLVEIEPLRVEERAEALRIQLPANERALRDFHKWRDARRILRLQSLPGEHVDIDTRSVQALQVGMKRAGEALLAAAADGTRVLALCQNEAEERRFTEVLGEQGAAGSVETAIGSVTKGFRLPAANLIVVNHREIKGVLGARRRPGHKAQHRVRALQSFFELKPGDLVVHAVHGLARFVRLERMARGAGGEEEHLHLHFADEVSLFVPSSRIDMVQRYIGTGSGSAPLDKIGGTTFRRRKEKVERGLFDLASELIEIQAKRALQQRPSWRADEELVHALIDSFPFDDTEDQVSSDAELAEDLYGPRSMDRLICGDVGFGKTELAVRAAFRVVNGGGQVAVLVPTTILAQQHYETFRERLADFPVEVATLSRYVAAARVREVCERAEKGEVDILVGTHRILSKDVQFARLGLVIIDEEQRFGVKHKEHFKQLRASVDILTLTATPIPRTLHMSLSGIRDISSLNVPPPGRQEIETRLAYAEDDDLIQSAIRIEKNRGGQVFFLHNRVASIGAVAARIQALAPDCSLAIGHGQMSGRELREVMNAFTSGDVDVLVATTIIENGIDIPTANTILIDDADRFGLAELHQLRGRVGRGSHKGHCYLLVERTKPLRDVARERLKALEELNHLGAGFGISVKDLELRGAGNILGAQQSGHIAAVGYDMYCRLLKLTVERLHAGESFDREAPRIEEREAGPELELGLRAFLPESWIPGTDTRVEILRTLSEIHSQEDQDAARALLKDRFGRIPAEAESLLRVFLLRAHLQQHDLRRLAWHGTVYLIEYDDPVAMERLFGGRDVDLRRIRHGLAHLAIPAAEDTAERALAWFEGLLKGSLDAATMGA